MGNILETLESVEKKAQDNLNQFAEYRTELIVKGEPINNNFFHEIYIKSSENSRKKLIGRVEVSTEAEEWTEYVKIKPNDEKIFLKKRDLIEVLKDLREFLKEKEEKHTTVNCEGMEYFNTNSYREKNGMISLDEGIELPRGTYHTEDEKIVSSIDGVIKNNSTEYNQ